MMSSHLYLGLPLGLVVKGYHLNIFLVVLASGILCIWPNQLCDYIFVLFQFVQFFIQYKKKLVTKVEQRKKLDRLNDDGRKKTRYTEITLATWNVQTMVRNWKEIFKCWE